MQIERFKKYLIILASKIVPELDLCVAGALWNIFIAIVIAWHYLPNNAACLVVNCSNSPSSIKRSNALQT